MQYSLIVPTINRINELEKFLRSMIHQSYKEFEIIIVDQNENDSVRKLIEKHEFSALNIIYCRSEKGLSRARNCGMKYAQGRFIAFPDDDCWYTPDVLDKVNYEFETNPHYDGISGRCVDHTGTSIDKNLSNEFQILEKSNVWNTAKSVTIFLKKEIIDAIGYFDEKLGVGAELGAGEETDYILRAIAGGFSIYYLPDITIGHPKIITSYSNCMKVYNYTKGMGYVLKKHHYPFSTFLWLSFKSVAGIGLGLFQLKFGKAKYHYYSLMGKINGYYY